MLFFLISFVVFSINFYIFLFQQDKNGKKGALSPGEMRALKLVQEVSDNRIFALQKQIQLDEKAKFEENQS